jgi:hypothetical protein
MSLAQGWHCSGGPQFCGPRRILWVVADRTPNPEAVRREQALQVACQPARLCLLRHAVLIGDFTAGEAAAIAGLPARTGTARSTHAGALCDAGLLERDRRAGLRFFATEDGRRLYRLLQQWLDRDALEEAGSDAQTLRAGKNFELRVDEVLRSEVRLTLAPADEGPVRRRRQ